MKMKYIVTVSIIVIVLIAFITNPSIQKHKETAVHQVLNDGEDSGILSGISKLLIQPAVEQAVEVDNYYVFSLSYINSNKKGVRLRSGFGIFGQVFPIGDQEQFDTHFD